MEEKEDLSEIPIENEGASASLSLADVDREGSSSRSYSLTNDIPVEANQHDSSASLPTAEEIKGTVTPSRERKRCRIPLWAPILLLVIIGIILGLALGLSGRSDDGSKSSSQGEGATGNAPWGPSAPSSPNSPNVPPSSSTEPATFEDIVEYLTNQELAWEDDLFDDGSPQNLAARWLAEEDEAALPIPRHSVEHKEGYLYLTRYVMVLVYFAMNGDNWITPMDFLTSKDVCDWNGFSPAISGNQGVFERAGLQCDSDSGMPVLLDLEYNNVEGEIPSEIGLLTTLVYLDMEYNGNIVGTIPEELCDLINLTFVSFKNNALEGTIPECIGAWTALQYFDLINNDLSGTFPEDVCDLTDMNVVFMDQNNLEGEIPSCFGKWSELIALSFSDNLLSGELPAELANLVLLEELYLDDNDLEGNPIPIVNQLVSLELMYIEDNLFEGEIDKNFAKDLISLRVIDISNNNFTSKGTFGIPPQIFELPDLIVLDMSENFLEGNIPTEIPQQDSLRFISVHENLMGGGIPSQLKNLTSLQHLDLSNNMFHGPIRSEIFEMNTLINLFLANNPRLHAGPIPELLSNMTQLVEISLKNTNRTGPLPEFLGFQDLFLLDLDNNRFTGSIPANYGRLPRLRYLLLNRNKISGDLPVFNETSMLQTVLLDGTDVTGDFESICSLPAFTGDMDLAGDEIIVADCGDEDTKITCSCCHCCYREDDTLEESCSDPLVASLDWTWEFGFRRSVRDFAINMTFLNDPEDIEDGDLPVP